MANVGTSLLCDVYQELRKLEESNSGCPVPRSAAEVQDVVKIILKSSGKLPASLITQSIVRRDVVLHLIREQHARGHPLYQNLDLSAVEAKAKEHLPENGPLVEVTQAQHDETLDKILMQKAACPHPIAESEQQVFDDMRPNAVLQEKSGQHEADEIITQEHVWTDFAARLKVPAATITTSNEMQPSFVYDFLAKAYPFLYKSALACPDYGKKPTLRAEKGGPAVLLEQYTRCMNRRAEHQFRGSWCFGYTLWNINFREQLNRSRMLYALSQGNAHDSITTFDVAQAAEGIVRALRGSYTAPNGQKRPVNGDISKAMYSTQLSPLGRRLLYSVSAITKDIPGTHEVRRRARSITNSVRTQYGLPTFITLSPDECHNAIMLRLVRVRRNDPAVQHNPEVMLPWVERLQPPLVGWDEKEPSQLPSYEVRRRLLTNSAISAADGFKIHFLALVKYIFGCRVCLNCPHCSCNADHDSFCADAEGLICEVEGGSLGRLLCLVGTSEFQKKRDEHVPGMCRAGPCWAVSANGRSVLDRAGPASLAP